MVSVAVLWVMLVAVRVIIFLACTLNTTMLLSVDAHGLSLCLVEMLSVINQPLLLGVWISLVDVVLAHK